MDQDKHFFGSYHYGISVDADGNAMVGLLLDGAADPAQTVPLISLAWARSGDKGNLFNVAVIARDPDYLPYIAAALTPERVSEHYGRVLEQGGPLPVERFSVPGLSALNFVVMNSMEGGVMASSWIDPVAKGMAQLLLDFPVPVSAGMREQLDL